MYKIRLSDKYLPIKVTSYESGRFEVVFELDFHKNPGRTLKNLIRDYVHELRMDDYKYRNYTVLFGTNTVVSVTGYRGRIGKTIMVIVTRKTGTDLFTGKNTYKSDTVLDEFR